jgi:hypothetical protein
MMQVGRPMAQVVPWMAQVYWASDTDYRGELKLF